MQIRQEIGGYDECTALDSVGWLHLDTTDYDGTVTYTFEVCQLGQTGATVNLRRKGTTTDDATIVLSNTVGDVQRVDFTPPTGATDYVIHNATFSGEDLQVRIIVLQSGFTKTKTQIDVTSQLGTSTTINSTTFVPNNAEFWKYVSANYDGSPSFQWVITWVVSDAAHTATAELQTSTDDGGSWSAVGSDITTNSTTPVRTLTTFTPTDGNLYRILVKIDNAGFTLSIVTEQIVITQASSPTKFELQYCLHNSTNGMGRIGVTKWVSGDWIGVTNTYNHACAVVRGNPTGDTISLRSPPGTGSSLTGSSLTDDQTKSLMISGSVTMPASANIDFNYSSSVNNTITDSRILVAVVQSSGGEDEELMNARRSVVILANQY